MPLDCSASAWRVSFVAAILGISGSSLLIFFSTASAASCRIFWESSFAASTLMLSSSPCLESMITPWSRSPISPSSLSAAGKMSVSPLLTLRSTLIVGARLLTASPKSITVLSLSAVCSSASRAYMMAFSILRISASSFARTLARVMSWVWYALTTLANSVSSRFCRTSEALSSLCICSSMRLVAWSMRCFADSLGGEMASFMRVVKGVFESCDRHLSVNSRGN